MYNKICSGVIAFLLVSCAVISHAQVAITTPEQVTNNAPVQPYVKQQYDEDAYTWYAAYADSKNIYVSLAVKDSTQKAKLLQNGMELWVDSKGKKNKVTGIMFPLGEKANVYPGGGNRNAAGGPPSFFTNNPNENKNADSMLAQKIGRQTEAELKGFTGDVNGRQPLKKLTGFAITLGMQHDTMVYNVVIPISNISPADKGIVSIGIFEKGVELPGFDGGGPGGDMGGDGPPGGGPPSGGGMGPGGDGPADGFDMRRLFQTNVIWYKVKLHS